ncbi:hypothetical protein ACFE04_021622 [Oxalis oulophora]
MKQYVFQSEEPGDEDAAMSRRIDERIDVDSYISRAGIIPEARYLHESFLMFTVFRPMFSDLTLRIYKILLDDVRVFTTVLKSPEEAFKLVDVELGFLYDVFYTKRVLLNTAWGAVPRCISCVSSFVALIAFMMTMGFGRDEESVADMCISYSLLIGAVGLDIYSVIVHCFSNWAIMRVTRETNWITGVLRKVVVCWLSRHKDEFKSMAQFNLIDFCLVSRASPTGAIEKFLDTDFILRKYKHTKWQHVNFDLKTFIYSHLTEKCKKYQEKNYNRNFLHQILDERGDYALKMVGVYEDFKNSTTEVEYNCSLILWHIATCICYYNDCSKYGVDILGKHCQFSKDFSDYMLYLQVIRPSMLPKGIGEVRFRDTCELPEDLQMIEYQPPWKWDTLHHLAYYLA